MRFKFTDEQNELRKEISVFFKTEWSPAFVREAEAAGELARGHSSRFYQKLAEKGWIALSWPKEYGGKGWSHVEMAMFNEEAGYHRAPMSAYALTSIIGNSIIAMGSEELKTRLIPGMGSGQLRACIGYTEPNAGSDLASLECRAVEDGDEYVINGQKIFNSSGHVADYCWLATRTDTQAPKHKGITVFIVDMKSPGITVRPLHNAADSAIQNELIFEDVRVPRENMVGEKNRGWYLIAKALDIERSYAAVVGESRRALDELIQYCKETTRNGAPLSKDPIVRQQLAQLAIEAEGAQLIAYEVAWLQTNQKIPDVLASMSKLYGSELVQRIAHTGLRILGLRGVVHGTSKWSAMNGSLELTVRSTIPATVAGGSSEIQRQIIALRGLGLPRG